MKIGPGATPIKTDRGWLNIYHGVFETMSQVVYRLGVALHDLGDPSKNNRCILINGFFSPKILGK